MYRGKCAHAMTCDTRIRAEGQRVAPAKGLGQSGKMLHHYLEGALRSGRHDTLRDLNAEGYLRRSRCEC